MEYAILGKMSARVRIDGRKQTVHKRVHVMESGRSICNAENAFKSAPTVTYMEPNKRHRVCKICEGIMTRGPSLSVLMGERMA